MKISISQVETLLDRMHTALRRHGMANAKADLDRGKADEYLQRGFDAFEKYVELVMAEKPRLWLANAERDAEFTRAVIKIGQSLRGGQVYGTDHFYSEVLAATRPEHAEFWVQQSPGSFARMLEDYPEIATAAEQSGVLAWVSDNPTRIRLVNTAWLTSEDEITEFVTEPAPMGRRCRFCTAAEPHDSMELQPVESGQSGKLDVLVSGLKGRRQAVFNPGLVYAHTPCQDYWLKWVDIARRKHREAT